MNAFLERHEVDVGRVLAVLCFSAAIDCVYGATNSLLIFLVSPVRDVVAVAMGTVVVALVVGGLAAMLGIALWNHAPAARNVMKVLIWMAFTILVAVMVFGPFAEEFLTALAPGMFFDGGDMWMRIVPPLIQIPMLFVTLAALDCQTTRRRFRER